VLAGHERPHLDVGLEAVADLDVREPVVDRLDEPIRRISDGHDLGDRHAPFTGRAVRRAHGSIGSHVDVGVREDDHVVLRAAERLDTLPMLRAVLIDVTRDRCGADERQSLDVRVLDDRVHRDFVSVHHVEDPVGDAGLLQQLCGVDGR